MSEKNKTEIPGETQKQNNLDEKPTCFILMPISDPESYKPGHFKRVYEQIFKPACEKAGYKPVRADDVKQTNLIHLDMLQKILEAPMALCDLSTRNPNAMFELGIRQAFDKPVVLVQEIGTKSIFDIAPLRYTEYRNDLFYEEVIQDQENIAKAIKETEKEFTSGQGVNSIVKLLSLTKSATLPDTQDINKDPLLQVIMAEIKSLRKDFSDIGRLTINNRTERVYLDTPESKFLEGDFYIDRDISLVEREVQNLVTSTGDLNEDLIISLKGKLSRIRMRLKRKPELTDIYSSRIIHLENEIKNIEAAFTPSDDDIPF